MFALHRGLHEVVRSSITGSILGNLLLVLGAAMFYGGTKYSEQKFSRTGAQINVGMLWIAIVALVVPSLMSIALTLDPSLGDPQFNPSAANNERLLGEMAQLSGEARRARFRCVIALVRLDEVQPG